MDDHQPKSGWRLDRPSLSLAQRVLLWVLPLALLGIFVSTAFIYTATRNQILRDVRKQVDGLANIAANSLEGYFLQRRNDLDAIAESPLLFDYHKNKLYGLDEEAETYRRDIETYLWTFLGRTRAYDHIRFHNASGQVVASAGMEISGAQPSLEKETFQKIKALTKGRRYHSRIYHWERAAHPSWIIGKSLYDSEGGLRGAIVLSCSFEPILKALAEHEAGKNSSAVLINNAGETILGTSDAGNQSVLVGIRSIPGTPWRVRISARMEDFIAPLKRIWDLTVSVSLSCALGVILLIFLQVRALTAPIRSLAEASRRLGEGDLSQRVAVTDKGEIGVLGKRFNAMAAHLEERTQELESRVRQLSALKTLSDAASGRPNREEIAAICLKSAVSGLGFERGSLFIVDEKARLLRGLCTFNTEDVGILENQIRQQTFALDGNDILACVARQRRPEKILSPSEDPRCDQELVRKYKTESFCAAPIMAGSRVYAVIGVDKADSQAKITDEDVAALMMFCDAAGLVFKNRELFENIRQSEARYRSVVDSSADAIIGLDADLKVTVWSRGAKEIFGYPSDVMLGETITRLFSTEDYRRLKRLALEKGPLINFETRGLTCTKKNLDISITWAGSGEDSATPEWSLVIRNVTSEKALRSHLIQAEKLSLTGQLLSGVAHELNNPLGNVIGYAEILQQAQESKHLPQTVQDDLSEIATNAKRCAAIVDNLLLFVRKPQLRRAAVSINTAVTETLHLLKYSMKKQADIHVHVRLEKGLPLVSTNLQQLEQVLVNIVQNACRAMQGQPGEKAIEIVGRLDRDKVLIEIHDNGPGIALINRKKIFEPFFTTKEDGTGLGLAICSQIIRDYGGEIQCDASPTLSGAVFRIRLPQSKERALPDTHAKRPIAICKKRILIADDEESSLALMRRLLEEDEHTIIIAHSGKEASLKLRDGVYDLLISDLHMGEIDGQTLMEQAAQLVSPPAQLLVTGDIIKAAQKNFELKNIPVLAKPFSIDTFRDTVRRLLAPQNNSTT